MIESNSQPTPIGTPTEERDLFTETIDLTGLITVDTTQTGSFDLRSVQAHSLTKLLNGLPMPTLLVDREQRVIFANECWERTLAGCRQMKGCLFCSFFPDPDQALQAAELIDRTLTDRKSRTRKLALNTPEKLIWGRMHLRSLRLAREQFILVLYQDLTAEREQIRLVQQHSEELKLAHDELELRVRERTAELQETNERLLSEVAERRRTDAALRESEANYRAIFDAANDAIFVHDAKTGALLDVNQKMCELFGYSHEEARHLTLQDLSSDDSPDSAARWPQFMRMATEGSPQLFEWLTCDRTGRSFWVEVNLKRAVIGGQNRLLAVVRDITERKRLEEQLLQAQKMEAVGRLAGGIAHDFNNVLTVILGYSRMLLQQIPPEQTYYDKVHQIIRSAERCAALTSQLLAFSRKQVLDVRVLDLNSVISELEGMLGRVIGEDIRLMTALSPSLATIRADRCQIEQVLLNLALNARDAMPRGGELIIETSNAILDDADCLQNPDLRPGPHVLIRVSDSGHGMSPETLSRIFEPFFTTKEKGEGTGLGLAMVYGIVKQHQGHIAVESQPGCGSTFRLYWPSLRDCRELAPGVVTAEPVLCGGETLLVVEDEGTVRHLICEVLEMLGYSVYDSGSADAAIRMADSHQGRIDLLVTDVVMPKMNGKDLYERLVESRPDLKVIFMSGFTETAIVSQGVLTPGVNFLQKPFTGETLARRIRDVLDKG